MKSSGRILGGLALACLAGCGADAATVPPGASVDGGAASDGGGPTAADGARPATDASAGTSPVVGGCPLFPGDFIFNTAIDSLPVDPGSAAYLATIGTRKVHLDMGTQTDQSKPDFYGIPYNVVKGASLTWAGAKYYSADPGLSWDARAESDCATGPGHTLVSPCTAGAAPSPVFPIPAAPLVEGGVDATPSQPYADHHILVVDSDACRLWETYHSYPDAKGGWDIFGSASWDLRSNALRNDTWTSADAAGFPMLALLLRADEAAAGAIRHALRFTIQSNKIRKGYVWPARHLTSNGTTSANLPPMGQLFRLKAGYAVPPTFHTQSKAIVAALKTYGMYIADGGSDLFVTGEPSVTWDATTFGEVQSIVTTDFEAVDITAITSRAGFDPNSGAVPPK